MDYWYQLQFNTIHPMNTRLIIFNLLLLSIFTSCNNQDSLPENNNFSYLDSLRTENEINNLSKSNQTPSKDSTFLNCTKIHRELLGNIFQKSERINNSNEFKNFIVLTLNTNFALDCDDNQQVKVEQVELIVSPEFNIDQYFGYSVMVVGEISMSNDKFYPVKMEALRIEPIKGSIQ